MAARRCSAGHARAMRGSAGLGDARQGLSNTRKAAWPGKLGCGWAMPGMARQAFARRGSFFQEHQMREVKAAELVLDFDLYPRNNIDPKNISKLVNALSTGAELPPVMIEKKSKRVVDGFHRVKAHLRFYGDEAKITVVEKTYKSDGDLFLDAMRFNSGHGVQLDSCDQVRCLLTAERLHIPPEMVAGVLHIPANKLGELRDTRTARGTDGLSLPLKRTVSGFHGKKLTERQEQANTRLSGMNQQFYVNQIIELIESEMLDTSDEKLMTQLQKLAELLDGVFAAK